MALHANLVGGQVAQEVGDGHHADLLAGLDVGTPTSGIVGLLGVLCGEGQQDRPLNENPIIEDVCVKCLGLNKIQSCSQ